VTVTSPGPVGRSVNGPAASASRTSAGSASAAQGEAREVFPERVLAAAFGVADVDAGSLDGLDQTFFVDPCIQMCA